MTDWKPSKALAYPLSAGPGTKRYRHAQPGQGGLVHVIGAGGSGLSALAQIYLQQGYEVTGSDSHNGSNLDKLRQLGARIAVGHGPANVSPAATYVVASASIGADNPELAEARRQQIPVFKYAEALGREFAAKHERIAVAGTHGKTTTTGMIAYILAAAERNPSYVVGAPVASLGRSATWQPGELFVVEACEFDRSFLNLSPNIAVITNIEADHLDYYRDLEEIHEAFLQFVDGIPSDGVLICHETTAELFRDNDVPCRIVTYGGSTAADWRVESTRPIRGGGQRFSMAYRGKIVDHALTRLSGMHNAQNCLAALLAVQQVGVPLATAVRCLTGYSGANRRFQPVAEWNGITVIDDYAHHPTEVRAVLRAARESFGDGRRIIAVFQGHQHSRALRLRDEFAASFDDADEIVLPDIYTARDTAADIAAISANDLTTTLRERGKTAIYSPEIDAIPAELMERLQSGDVVITMGAGDVDRVARGLAQLMREAS